MKLTSILKAAFAVGAFVAFASFGTDAAAQPPDQVTCARQLRACKRQCDLLKAEAKRALDQCTRTCYEEYRACLANAQTAAQRQACREALIAHLRDCRAAYATAIAQVNQCYQSCRDAYIACTEGGYDGQEE